MPLFILIASLYFFTRGIQLLEMPIFIDEATFLGMARAIIQNPLSPFVSLSHGHQPLHSWLLVLSSLLFSDPLVGGRIVSVLAGFGSLLGLWLVGRLYGLRVGASFASFSFVFSPLFLLHDRLAIKDSFLACVAIWFFYGTLRWFKDFSYRWMFLAAFFLGMGLLTKSIASFFVLLAPLSLFYFPARQVPWKKFFLQGTLFGLLVLGMHSILRLSKGYHNIDIHTFSYLLSLSEFLKNPFQLFFVNGGEIWSWLNIYLGLPMILSFILAPFVLWRRQKRPLAILMAWSLIPILFECLFAHNPFPRYFLFTLLFWYLLIGVFLESLWNFAKQRMGKRVFVGLGLFVFINLWSPFLLSHQILFHLKTAPFAPIDRWQYLEGWPAGYGLKEAAAFFQRQPKPCVILTEPNYLTRVGLPLYLENSNCRVEVALTDEALVHLEDLRSQFKGPSVFLVFNQRQEIPQGKLLKELASYPKAGNKESLRIFKFAPKGS